MSDILQQSPAPGGVGGVKSPMFSPDIKGVIASGQEAARLEGERNVAGADVMARAADQRVQADTAAMDRARQDTRPVPAFVPTKDTAADLSSLFGLIGVVGTALGSKGQGMNAMSAMTGMMQGYQQGNEDRYAKEYQKFQTSMQEMQRHNEQVQQELQRALKISETNMEAGKAHASLAMAKLDAPMLRAKVEAQGVLEAYKVAQQMASEERRLQQTIASEDRRHKNTMVEQAARVAAQAETKFIDVLDENGKPQKITAAELARRLDEGENIRPVPKGSSAAQSEERGQRMINALSGVTSAVNSINRLKSGATTGMLPHLSSKEGLLNYLTSASGRAMSADEEKFMNTYLAGIGRNLATLEASGLATGLVNLSNSLQSGVYINANEGPMSTANKIADIRRIAESAIEPVIQSGRISEDQRNVARSILSKLQEAVPFTTDDVADALLAKQSKRRPATTIGERSRALVTGSPPPRAPGAPAAPVRSGTLAAPVSNKEQAQPGEVVHVDANGIRAVQRDGKWIEVQ